MRLLVSRAQARALRSLCRVPACLALSCLALPSLALLGLLTACQQAPAPVVITQPDFADLVEKVSPVVVNISTVPREHVPQSGAQADSQQTPPGLSDEDLADAPEWLRRFFQNPPPVESEDLLPQPEQSSLGSGFVLWPNGYILTNDHVVRDAAEVTVRLLDRRQFTARLVGHDAASDLALLKIDATDLPSVAIGDAQALRPGQWVLAIGSPFGFDYSVTAGIVSAKGRALASEQYVPFIQTDVAINPGNSGGPLFNMSGQVVGVNSQIYSQSGGYQGVSFSIPIDVAVKVASQLRDSGVVTRGWLGVVVQEVDRDLAQRAKLEKPEGALVARVLADSPAANAGLVPGDVILRFNGQALPMSSTLPHLVGMADPGTRAKLDLMRDGKAQQVEVEIGAVRTEVQDQNGDGATESASSGLGNAGPLGMTLTPLDDAERRQAQVLSGGLKVTAVAAGPARNAGIRVGDVLLQLAGQQVDSLPRLAEVVARLTPGQTIEVLIQRRGAPLFIALDVPAE